MFEIPNLPLYEVFLDLYSCYIKCRSFLTDSFPEAGLTSMVTRLDYSSLCATYLSEKIRQYQEGPNGTTSEVTWVTRCYYLEPGWSLPFDGILFQVEIQPSS